MFGFGFWEFTTLLVVAVIFLKPQDVPHFLRNLGRLYKWFQDLSKGISSTLQEAEKEIQKSVTVVDDSINNTVKNNSSEKSSSVNEEKNNKE